MSFDGIVRDLMADHPYDSGVELEPNSISLKDFEQWRKQFIWDALLNQRYGQSFCNYFGIQDHRIYYERNWQVCDKIIRREWLATS